MKKVTGLLAAALLVGGTAFAGGDKMHEDKNKQTQTQTESQYGSQPATGGSSTTGSATTGTATGGSAQAGEQEISGEVVKAQGNTVYVDHMGAVLPVELDKSTKFEGQGLSSKKDLKKGQQIKAKISVKNEITNLAKSIELKSSGMGGSGDFGTTTPLPSDSPDQATEPSQGTTPPASDPGMSGGQEAGTGGSGSETESTESAPGSTSDQSSTDQAKDEQAPTGGSATPERK